MKKYWGRIGDLNEKILEGELETSMKEIIEGKKRPRMKEIRNDCPKYPSSRQKWKSVKCSNDKK